MDLEPSRREHNMARWTVAGSVGAIVGPLLVAAAAWAGLGWRGLFLALGVRDARGGWRAFAPVRAGARRRSRCACARRCARSRGARCCAGCVLLELADLLLDVFVGFLALYLVDEAGASHATAGLAVAAVGGRGARRARRR